jgi:hypothetical protein
MPRIPRTLTRKAQSIEVNALVDSGSALNLLPYGVGLALGAQWDELVYRVQIAGSFGSYEGKGLLVDASHPLLIPGKPVQLAFAWTQREDIPVILGQVNSFTEFDICFYRSQASFEINSRHGS